MDKSCFITSNTDVDGQPMADLNDLSHHGDPVVVVLLAGADGRAVVRRLESSYRSTAKLLSMAQWVGERDGRWGRFWQHEMKRKDLCSAAIESWHPLLVIEQIEMIDKLETAAQLAEERRLEQETATFAARRAWFGRPRDEFGRYVSPGSVQSERFHPRGLRKDDVSTAFYFISAKVDPNAFMETKGYDPRGYGPGGIRPIAAADGAPVWAKYVVFHSTNCD